MFDGDIYYVPSASAKPLRLTHTEQERHVVNGLSDWTYEGGMRSAFPRNHSSVGDVDFPFSHRGGAPDLCGPLVVWGRGSAGVPHHQQLGHPRGGNTSLPRWPLSHQHGLPIPQGANGTKRSNSLHWLKSFSLGLASSCRNVCWAPQGCRLCTVVEFHQIGMKKRTATGKTDFRV